jgi:hypothetical protein
MSQSIGLKRGIGHFSSPLIDGEILQDANDRSNIQVWFFYNR